MAEPQHEPAQPQEQRPVSAEGTSGQEEHAAATAVEGSRQEEEEEEEIATKAGEEEKRTTTEGKAGEEAEKVPTKTPSAADHPVEVPTEDAQTEVAAEVRAKEEEEEEEQPEEPFQHLDLLKRDEIVVELQKLGLPVRSSISAVCFVCRELTTKLSIFVSVPRKEATDSEPPEGRPRRSRSTGRSRTGGTGTATGRDGRR
jgi:archaellum component FlaD/FlaE